VRQWFVLSAENLASIDAEGRSLVTAARQDPNGAVPQYPGWSLSDLASHVASIHGRTVLICRDLPRERISAPGLPEGLNPIDWCEWTLQEMLAAFTATEPDTAVWAFGSDQTLGFWERRMVVETGIHRWDACQAIGDADRLTDRVAAEGLEEVGDLWHGWLGEVQTLQVNAIDLGKSWVYGEGDPTASVEGTASELVLALMQRPSSIELPQDWTAAVNSLAPPPKR
jgi:uncharacterized protein (TIGR03083 family)